MNYYNENTNKIRRRKVSSNDSVSKPVENKQSVERKSNNNNIKKEKVKPKNKPRNKNKVIKLISVVCLVALVICSAVGSVVTISALKGAPKVTKELIEDTYISSEIINVDEIPKDLKNALVAIEDQRFYEHKGVDYKSLIRSLLNNIFSETTQGGSTIEMQISKNLLTNDDRSIKRKIRDIYNATQMDKIMTKEEILGVYLNNVYFGKSSYGVAKASKAYFSKTVQDLSLAQSAMLVGITNNPAKYLNHIEAKKRQETILYKMNELGYITKEEYKDALYEKVPFKSEIQ